ncbi:ribosome biogenesis GTPase YlqF [Christensenellaceae bacterium OttesenSCG-928-L17]|nr:ribosome biogenesis GTPase YlqF [Christensenellaceae bacterium OttesenSCG-928-L17]
MVIQWYPGHMAKAKRMLQENLKLVDVVVELVDARAPRSTSNPDFDTLFRDKQRIMVLNKSDLANPETTKRWVKWYEQRGIAALPYVSTSGDKKKVIALIERASAERVARMKQKGVIKTVRVMVVGIPNVGKSTFINRIAGAARAKVGDKPGVTRGKQWVKIGPYLELMDTPGLLWPKLENEVYAQRLAFLGSIKDEIMDVAALAAALLTAMSRQDFASLQARYARVEQNMEGDALLLAVAKSRGFRLPAGEWDTERAARIVLDEYRAGRIARITLDEPEEVEEAHGKTKA